MYVNIQKTWDSHEISLIYPIWFYSGDAAVTRTEKLRELRQDISKTVQEVGASWTFKGPSITPWKINGWNMSSRRFGSDHFPF